MPSGSTSTSTFAGSRQLASASQRSGERTTQAPEVDFEAIVDVCLRSDERQRWSVFKAVPTVFPARHPIDLTEEEWVWCVVQLAIDQGFGRCRSCGHLGFGPHCADCGKLLHGEDDAAACLQCKGRGLLVVVHGRYCTQCGAPTEDTLFLEQLKGGNLRYDDLNEQTRGAVDDTERAQIENSMGGNYWDEAGLPRKQVQ